MKDWSHQLEANAKAGAKPGFGYFMEMGTGKTKTFIDKLREHINREKRILRTIVFTPPMVVPQFKEEFLKFSKIPPKDITLLTGSGARRLKTFREKAFDARENSVPHLFITNYETLLLGGYRDKKKRGNPYVPGELFEAMKKWAPEVLGFDEGHRIKSHEAIRSKLAAQLANPWDMKAARWAPKPWTYLLTGTPLLNSPLDIFQPFKVMLGGFPTPAYFSSLGDRRHLIDNYYHFRARFFRDHNAGMPKDKHYADWQPMTLARDGVDGLAQIREIIDHYSYHKTKAECLDLPPEVSVVMRVGMSDKQARAYQEMKAVLLTYINDKACRASMALTKALRLMQITAGFASVESQGEDLDTANIRFEETPKLEALKELLETLTPDHKVLVWAVWKDNYAVIRDLCEKLKIEIVEAHGGVSDAKKREAVARFQNDSHVRVFLGHPGSGGIGLNLVQAPYSVFYSRTFSLEHYLQARARNHRGGSEIHDKITHYDLVCLNTIEEVILDALANKIQIGENMLGDVAKRLATQA